MKRVTLSFGGNALGITHQEQIEKSILAAQAIVDVAEHNQVMIVTGNGPISGNISLGLDYANEQKVTKSTYSLANVVSMTQGSIGTDFVTAIQNELNKRNINKKVVTIVTHCVIDKNDEKFKNPSKPIGAFYSAEEAEELSKANNWVMKEDAGRGYRRMVPSPLPIDVMEKELINTLLEQDYIVICGVGGGIPVYFEDGQYHHVDAVIDKDFTSALIGELTDSESLIILTEAKGVAINYGTPEEKWLGDVKVAEMEEMIADGIFPDGSMGPKVKAAVSFAKTSNHPAIIADLENAISAVEGKRGTTILP